MESWDAIVIGAGISGMCAASLLAGAGKRVLVLKKQDQIGGRATTLSVKIAGEEYRMDNGSFHAITMADRGGEKIFPAEVESIINRHPKVLESAVIGVSDPYWGEKVEAFVVLQPGTSASEEEVIDFCRSRLAGYKKPALIKFLPELPKNALGKVLKYLLRQQASQGGPSK